MTYSFEEILIIDILSSFRFTRYKLQKKYDNLKKEYIILKQRVQ